MIRKICLPILPIWGIVSYIHLLSCLRIFGILNSAFAAFALFLPVLYVEFYLAMHFAGKADRRLTHFFSKMVLSALPGQLLWSFFFIIWALYIPMAAHQAQWLKWFIPEFYLCLGLVYIGERWISVLAVCAWIWLYYQLTIKRGKFRLLTSLIFPGLASAAMFVHLYYFGGTGSINLLPITRQAGVERVISVEMEAQVALKNHPRAVFYDRRNDALFAAFGCTFCNDNKHYPVLVRLGLIGKTRHVFESSNIRTIHFDTAANTLFLAPWYQKSVFELSMGDLSVKNKYENVATGLEYWEPMDILKSGNGRRLYVGNDVIQALISYNLENGAVDGLLNVYHLGHVKLGGPIWNIIESHKTGDIYFTTGPGHNLFKLNGEDLSIKNKMSFLDGVGTALVLDDQKDLLYYQNGWKNTIYEVDAGSFQVIRKLPGEGHARRIALDDKRNCLYVLGYFSGRLFSIDLATGKRAWALRVGGSPHGLHVENDHAWVNSMTGVVQINLKTVWAGHGRS